MSINSPGLINLLHKAKEQAYKSQFRNYRLGSLVLNKKKIIAKGFNTSKTHAKMTKEYGYLGGTHAEAKAILSAEGKGDTLVVVRIKKNGHLSMAFPCEKCLQLIKDNDIKWIIFSDWNGTVQKIKL